MFVSPTVVGDAVVVGSCAGSVYALDRQTGAPFWLHDANADGGRAQFHGEPLLIGERLVIPNDGDPKGHLYSFDRSSGELLWKVAADRGFGTTPVHAGDRIVAVTARGEVVAVDAGTGGVIWRRAPAGLLEPLPFLQSPARAGERLFMADNTGRIFALDIRTGATLWQKALGSRANTALVVAAGELVVGTMDGAIHWIAPDSGATKKRVQLEEGFPYGTPISSSSLLFVLAAGEKGILFALNQKTGAVRWKQETPKEWTTFRPLISGSTVIVGDAGKNLCGFDTGRGNVRWCRSVGQVPRGLGISSDGTLYVGSLSGVVQAFRVDALVR